MRVGMAVRVLLMVAAAALPDVARAQHADWPPDQPFMPHRGRIGVQVQPMSTELREHFGAPGDRGLLVNRVEPGRPAAQADLRVGDVIVDADGVPMREPFDLVRVVGGVPAGGALELRVVRDKREHVIKINPEGEPSLWLDPDRWGEMVEKGMRRGSEELRHRLDQLERRLEELERKLDQKNEPHGGDRT